MSIEINCPGCRFLFRADDEFAGESAPCPYCGANIVVPHLRPVEITHQGSASDERVSRNTREIVVFPLTNQFPELHRDNRGLEPLLPDEDRPPRPHAPLTPRQLALSNSRFDVIGYFVSCFGCWVASFWQWEEQLIQSALVGLFGCLYFAVGLKKGINTGTMSRMATKVTLDADEDETPDPPRWIFWSVFIVRGLRPSVVPGETPPWWIFWELFYALAHCCLLVVVIFGLNSGIILVLTITVVWDFLFAPIINLHYRYCHRLRA